LFTRYKLSRYNVLVEDNGTHLLYNQVSGVLVKLNDRLREYQKIGKTTLCFSSFKRKLRKHKFLVPADQDELEEFKEFFHRYVANNREKRLVIVVTGRCNANCFYCYEKEGCDQRCSTDMSADVQNQLVRFVDRCISATPTDRLTITWYGGEPLLRPDIVYDLAVQLREVCKKRGVVFSNNIITNGILLNDEVIDKLLAIDCRSVQITIDGLREFHDKRRPIVNSTASSYDTIMENLIAGYSKGLEIDVRSNLDYSNCQNYRDFLSEMFEKGLNKRNEAGGIVCPAPAVTRFPKGLAMKQEDFAAVTNAAIEMLKGKTERYRFLARMMPGCMKHMPCYYNVSPDGSLTKCIGHLFDDSEAVGTIFDLELAEKDSALAPTPFEDPECVACPYLPSCGGGCVDRHKKYDHQPTSCSNACSSVCHYGGCQPVRWTLEKAIVGLYHYLEDRGELGGHKE